MHLGRLHSTCLQALLEDLAPEQAHHAGRLAAFLYKQLRNVLLALHRANLSLPYGKVFLHAMRQLWRPNDGHFRFAIPDNLQLPGLPMMAAVTANGQNPHVKLFQNPDTKQRYAVVLIDVKRLAEADNVQDVGRGIQEILYHVVHEPVHVHNYPAGGTPFAPTRSGAEDQPLEIPLTKARKDMEQAATPEELAERQRAYGLKRDLYLVTPWEVEAYGRQLAMFYHRRNPTAPFNKRKFLADFATWSKRHQGSKSVNNVVSSYFGKFRKPDYQGYTDKRGQQPFRNATAYIDNVIATEVQRLIGQN